MENDLSKVKKKTAARNMTLFIYKIVLVMSGIFFSFLLLELLLRLGCGALSLAQEYRNSRCMKQKGIYKIMCVGESTTAIGGDNSYPSQLEEILNQRGAGLKFRVINKGVSTIDSNYILRHIEENVNKYKPDMVVSMMGINDKYVKYYQEIPDAGSALFRYSAAYRFFRLVAVNIGKKMKTRRGLRGTVSSAAIDYVREQAIKEELFDKTTLGEGGEADHIRLGRRYRDREQYALAEEEFKKALGDDPENASIYVDLGWLYTQYKRYADAKDSFLRALKIDSSDKGALFGYGMFCSSRTSYRKAEEMFKKMVEIDPGNDKAYVELGWIYMRVGKYSQAEEILKRFLTFDPESIKINAALSILYRETGRRKLAQEFDGKIYALQCDPYSAVTIYNYRRLKNILEAKGIKLVCVGYPLRGVETLKNMFTGSPGVIIVSIEDVFKEALKYGRYRDYFLDMFGGNFGHCRRKGNRLIAQSIADAILRSR
ncbi:MAG: tetratricopeptide repeat protein [Candidatus Omnitrophota bacterium]|jgi:Tfp pilus assembly protein PilF